MASITRHGRAKDLQRARVYKWEQKNLRGSEVISPSEIKQLIIAGSVKYGIAPPALRFSGRAKHTATYNPTNHEIMLPAAKTWAHNVQVVLHELAHAVLCQKEHSFPAKNNAHHGAAFVGIMIDLVVAHTKENPHEIIRSARAHGVEVRHSLVDGVVEEAEVAPKPKVAKSISVPKMGTTSHRIWNLCDLHPNEDKSTIMDLCAMRGIHPGTASTQYSRWKKFHNQ